MLRGWKTRVALNLSRDNRLVLIWVNAQEPQHLLFFVATITARIDANSGEFATFAPALKSEG